MSVFTEFGGALRAVNLPPGQAKLLSSPAPFQARFKFRVAMMMMNRDWRSVLAALLAILFLPAPAQARPASPPVPRRAEMPELSGWGQGVVGTEFHNVATGGRNIGVRLWYPARATKGAVPATYSHVHTAPGQQPTTIVLRGNALTRAAPLTGGRFPLIILSHGYGGWDTHMSQLGEVLASHGYVVAAIDHVDQPVHDIPSFLASFGSVLLRRSADQQFVLHALLGGTLASSGVAQQIDRASVGLIGYSMGGYGTLITAGVPVDPAAPAYAQVPAATRAQLPRVDAGLAQRIKAVVAMAPWGAQPSAMVWDEAALGTLKTPLLLIDGDQDDVVDYQHGVRRIFTQAKGSDRYLLVYREAAHNIAGNPVTLPDSADFPLIEFTADPVWRKDRIEAINEHFILAFLDRTLKGLADRTRYLDVPTPIADDGVWPLAFGQQVGGKMAGDDQPRYWRGFQRRWARGLEMQHKAVGE